ncbi:hypothetical protein [Planobispora longispora]|uniref:Uncharacterized protein n=1 Tax=Planobispora longispora TaxID=28887 RepID=A0A8J3RHQ5_9ACTN|nr:hypothetical protein [Planobispora longispora]BFE86096.1 hypothetical protein GCM10020093_086970 [Planobispora longispora]GIH75937.1 hypothetical protein Plo01_23660 [Planobispora longispora]
MLKSKTRRRVMAKTAAIGAVGAGLIFGAVPALASMAAAPVPVTYTCETEAGVSATYKIQMELTGPTAPVPSSTVVATWKIGPSASPSGLTAPSAIPNTEKLVADADVLITSSPTIVPSELRSVAATGAAASISQGATLQPPNLLITMTPTATGVIAVQPDNFSLYLAPTNASDTDGELYECTVATAEASAAALRITVKPSTSSSSSTTPSSTPTTPTPTPTPSVKPTVTVFETVTARATRTRTGQIDKTPDGGASTGGGGDAGPDARVIMLAGALMVGGAAIGGLALRRRTAARG